VAVAKVCVLPGMTQIAGMVEADALCLAAWNVDIPNKCFTFLTAPFALYFYY